MQPLLYNGSVLFRKDWEHHSPELRNQLLFFGVWPHDDFPDVIEMGLRYIEEYGSFQFVKIGRNGLISEGKPEEKIVENTAEAIKDFFTKR